MDDVMLSNRTGGEVGRGGPLLGDWLGVGRLVVSNCFHCHHLSFFLFYFSLLVSFSLQFLIGFITLLFYSISTLKTCFYLNPWVFSL